MRIISQNGNVDLPYEKALIFHAMETVLARCEGYDKEIVLGEYSSMEKAYKAMERLREAHREYIATVTTTQGIAQTLVLIENNEDNQKLSTNIAKGIKEIACFQFPKDDEVEV